MIRPALFDTVELLIDMPDKGLRAGLEGAIVDEYGDESYEVEFANDDGETIELCTLHLSQFIVVWQSETRQDVAITEQVAQIVARLPTQASAEVLDFARFLTLRQEQGQTVTVVGEL